MEGKKRYIAIILFLLICLMVFTFATTSDEELEGTGNNIQEITDKDTSEKDDKKEETKSEEKEESKKENNNSNNTNSNSTNKDSESGADDEENLDGTGEVDNSAYDKALEAVEELEKLLTDAQADIARDLVEEVTNSDQYKELVERIEDAEDAIDAEELVAKLEAMVKEAAQKADITDAKDFRDEEVTEAVNEIDGENLEAVKEDLLDRIEELSKILDDNNDPTIDGIKDGEYTNLDEISLTIADENEVTIKVTKDGNEIDFAEKFTEEGTYEVTVVDAAFNDVTKTFTIDRTQPKFEGLASGQHYDIIKLDVKDASPVKITISKDHAKEVAIENGTEIKEDGTYRIVATDEAGNKKEIWVAIDSTPPTITPDVEYTNVKGQKVTIADKFLMTVTINGKEYTRSDFAKDKNNENFSMEYTLEEDGEYTIVAKDKKGLTVEKTIILDTVKPKFENLASREVDTDYYKVDVTDVTPVKIYVSKNHKAFEEIQEGYELTDEATYQLKAVDAAGNEYTTWIHIDKTAPTITVTPDKEYMNVCPTIEVFDRYLSKVTIDGKVYDRKDFTKNSSNENFKLNVTLEDCEDGLHTITAVDKRVLETTKTFTVDTIKAKITVETSNKGNSTNQDVTVTLTSNEPIVTPEGWTVVEEGIKFTKVHKDNGKFKLTVKDLAGNETPVNYEVKRIDRVAPEATVTTSNNGEFTNKDVTVTIFTNEAIRKPAGWTGIETTKKEHEFSKVYTKNGEYEVEITDKAGNKSTIKFTVTGIDKTAPKFAPEKWAYTLEADKDAKFVCPDMSQYVTDDYSGVKSVTVDKWFTENWSIPDQTKPGKFTCRYISKDNAGNSVSNDIFYTVVDTVAPKVTNVTGRQVSKGQYTKDQEITVTIEERVALDKVYYAFITDTKDNEQEIIDALKDKNLIDSSLIKDNEDGTYSFTIKTNFEGSRRLIVKAVDKAGNVSGYQTKGWYRIDNVAPEMNKLQVWNKTDNSNLYVKNGTELRVLVEFNETLGTLPVLKIAGYEDVQFKSSGNNIYAADIKIKENEKTLKQGLLEFTISGHKDIAGNDGVTITHLQANQNVTYDRTNPIVEGVNNNYYYNKPITITTIRDIAPIKSATIDDKPYELGTEYFEEGEHLLVIYDMAGNRLRVKFYMDETKPDLTITQSIGQNPGVCAADKSPNTTVIKSADKEWVITAQKDEHGTYWNCNEIGFLGEGEYTITTTDAAGNVSTGKTIIDLTAPVATPSYTEKTIEVNSVEEFTDFPTFEITDKYTKNIEAKLVSGKVDPTNVGSYKLVYRATDEAGNYSEVTVTVNVVDTTAPEVEASYTETTVSEDSEEEFTDFPTFKVTDNSKGDVKEELISGSVNIHKVGIYKLVYRFTDESGNYTDKTIIVKVVDTTAPTVTGLVDGAYYNTKDTHAIPVASDKNGAILMAKTKLGDVELKALIQNEKELKQVGTYTIYAVDTFGNKSEEYTVHIDPYAPKILVLDRIENISGAYLPIKPVILEHNIDKIEVTLNGKKIDYKAGDQLTKDGKYTMTVTDKANNSTTVEFTMDSVAPTMLVSPTTLGVVDSLDLNDVNNITGLILSEDAEFQLLKAGKNVTVLDKTIPIYEYTKLPEDGIINEEGDYILIAYDKAYNLTAVKFVVDRTAPSINAEDGKFYSSLTLDVKDKNLSTITVKKQGSLIPTVVENGHVIEKDGTYEITAKDIVGVNPLFGKDVQADHTTTITIHIDTKAPTSNVVEGGIYKKVTVSVSDANLDEDSITINGSKYNGDEITKEGNYVLVAKDLAGNTLTVNFEVDKTPITISGVTQNGLYKDDVELEVTARDEEPVIKLNGSEISKKFTINADGEYKVKVTDKWGNEEEVTFTIDKNRPKIKNPFPAIENEIGARKDSSVEVKALVTDNIDADKYINPVVKHDNPAFGDMGELSSIPTTKDYVGRYTLTYNTTDKAGNPADKLVVYVDVIINDYVVSFVDVDDNDFIYTYGDTIPAFEVQIYSGVLEEYVTFDASDIKIEEVDGKTIKEAGTYTVKASANTTKFPNAAAAEQVVTIDKKDVEVTLGKNHDKLSSIDRYEFNGVTDPFKVVGIDGVIAGDEVNTEIDYKGCTFGVGEWEATVKLTGKDSKNYNLTNSTYVFNITPAEANVIMPTIKADDVVRVENSEGMDITKYVTIERTPHTASGTQEIGFSIWKRKYEVSINYTIINVVSNNANVTVNTLNVGLTGMEDFNSIISLAKSIGINIFDDLTKDIEKDVKSLPGTSRAYITMVDFNEI